MLKNPTGSKISSLVGDLTAKTRHSSNISVI